VRSSLVWGIQTLASDTGGHPLPPATQATPVVPWVVTPHRVTVVWARVWARVWGKAWVRSMVEVDSSELAPGCTVGCRRAKECSQVNNSFLVSLVFSLVSCFSFLVFRFLFLVSRVSFLVSLFHIYNF
jgi:hypothetical protein